MAVNNDIYNRDAGTWWDENAYLYTIRASLNPGRFGYFRKVLEQKLNRSPAGKKTLDIGCGGGYLSEEFARLGCEVTGLDPSAPTLETARAHARQEGLKISYVHGSGENLPFPDRSFDVVYCCDVLEHVTDLGRVISETARVMKPDGVYLFDTINRTRRSRLVAIRFMQEWRLTALLPPDVHDWDQFIRPEELDREFARCGLKAAEYRGLSPAGNPLMAAGAVAAKKLGLISFATLGKYITMRESGDLSVSYMGYALKA